MKILVAICSIQLFLLLFLIVEIKSDDPAGESAVQAIDEVGLPNEAFSMPPAMDEERLRQIIREEVGQLNQEDRAVRQSEDDVSIVATEDPEIVAQQMEYVAQQIEYYKSLGSISIKEMDELQFEVAKLDSEGRKQMMSTLFKAMNAGEIDGRLQ